MKVVLVFLFIINFFFNNLTRLSHTWYRSDADSKVCSGVVLSVSFRHSFSFDGFVVLLETGKVVTEMGLGIDVQKHGAVSPGEETSTDGS